MATAGPKASFVVYSTAGQFDVLPASAQAILGEYVEDGSNHGKRIYKRKAGSQQRSLPEIVLFFWDMRDGKDLSGWWFGDKVGGGQVWAHNAIMSALPPQQGWRCPVDGPVQAHVVCKPKARPKPLEGLPGSDGLGAGGGKRQARGAVEPPSKRQQQAQTLVLMAKPGQDVDKEALPLLGEYLQQGHNHGKKTFLNAGTEGREAIWLYYWDSRDGRDSSGWWLGSTVGGEEVYARAEQHSSMPPMKGWRIPHDGAKSEVSLTLKGHEEDAEIPEEDRLQKVKELVSSLESKVDKTVETSQSMLDSEGDIFEEGVRAIAQMLEARVADLEDAKAVAARHSKAAKKQKASNETEAELGLLEERLDSALGKALKETAKAQQRLARCEREGAEERDAKAIEAALPGCMESVANAEMAAEAAATDDAATRARDLISTARLQVGKALESASGFAPQAQRVALAEFTSLQDRCKGAEERLALWEGSGIAGLDGLPGGTIDVEPDDVDPTAALPAAGTDGGSGEKPAETVAADNGDDGLEDQADTTIVIDLDPDLPEEELLKQISDRVAEVEADAKQALETATVVLKDDSNVKGVKLCLDLLEEHNEAVRKAQGRLAQEMLAVKKAKGVTPATTEAMRALGPRLQVARAHVSQELALARKRVARAQRQAREERDLQAAEVAMPLALEAVAQAEDAVEAVALEAGDLEWRRKQMETAVQFGEEYGEEIQRALEATQIAAEGAQDSISTARTRLDAQIRAARLLPGEQQKAALAEMAPVRRRLIDAQKKLNPYKRVQAEFDQQLKAKTELETLSKRTADIEAEIDGVGSALEGAVSSEDDVKSVEATIGPIQASLARTLKLLEQKSKGITGVLQESLNGIMERGTNARAKLDDLKNRARDERSQLVGKSLTLQAAKEVEKAEAWLLRIKEVEAPWTSGSEVLPEAQAAPALEGAEVLVKEAQPSLQATKTLVMEQLVEARQLPDGILRLKITEDLQRFQARVDTVALQMTQLKIDTFARRTKMQMTEVIKAVVKAEAEVQQIVKAAEPFSLDNLESVAVKKLKEVGANVLKCEAPIAKVCAEAREVVTQKQQDPRHRTSPSFNTQLSKLAGRLEGVEATLAGMKRAANEAEGNKKVLKAQKDEVAKLERVVADVELLSLPLGNEQPSEQAEEATALKARDAQEAVAAWRSKAEALANNPHGAMKLAMGRLLQLGDQLQQRLTEARAMIRGQTERALCRIFAREARAELQKAVAAMKRTEEAEGPFLKGIENLSPEQSAEAIAGCEASAAEATALLNQVQASISARWKEAQGYGCEDAASKAGVEELSGYSAQLEGLARKLAQYQSDTASRKRAASMDKSSQPPSKVTRKA